MTKLTTKGEWVEAIKDTFEKDLRSFSSKHAGHWSLRKYRMTANPFYREEILADFQKRTLNSYAYLAHLSDKKYISDESKRIVEAYKAGSDRRIARKATYEKTPELTFYTRVIAYLYFLHEYNIHKFKKIAPVFENSIKILKKVNWQKLFVETDLVASHPSSLANTTYYLYHLGVADIRKITEERIKTYWRARVCDRDEEYQLKIYGMTHLVLADSSYYQKTPTLSHSWVLTFLRENVDHVIARTNPDIMCEAALCFVLLGHGTDPVVRKLKGEVQKYFNPKLGFIPRDTENHRKESAEHRNILAVILFSSPHLWHPGPNLYEYMREEHRALYLPTTPLERVGSSQEDAEE